MNDPYEKQVGGDHYSKMKIQPSEFINKNEMLFAEGNAIKYICRHGSKGRLQDLLKAKHYIDMIIERDYSKEMKGSSVDSGVDISYEALSSTYDDTPTGHGTLSDDIKISYEGVK
tara:strand:+ start:169 stop:513 length:345 start_codon:yes stop_codon:yes gene_type:complete